MNPLNACTVLSVSALGFLAACGGPTPTVISGTLLGHDGEPMLSAGVRVSHWSTRDLPDDVQSGVVFQEVEDGRFAIETSETGLLAVRFVGAYHESHDVPIYAETPVTTELDVRLGTASYADGFERLMVGGNFGDGPFSTVAMELRPDGRYTAEIETEHSEVEYVIVEAKPGVGMNFLQGTDSDDYAYGRLGYSSVVRPIDGRLSITFDPSRLSQIEREAEATFREPDSFVAVMAKKLQRVADRYDAYQEAREDNGGEQFTYDWSEDIGALGTELGSEQTPLLRQALLLDLIRVQSNGGAVDPEIVGQALREIGPESHVWSFNPDLMFTAVEYLSRPASALTDSFSNERLLTALEQAELSPSTDEPAEHIVRALRAHPDPALQEYLIDWLVWMTGEEGDSARQIQYYRRLEADFPESAQLDYWKTVLSPDRNIASGKEIPDFSVTSLEDSTFFHTRGDLLGTVYLIDFWATWCAPCVAELPNIHGAYDEYKDRGFQVLSIAIGDKKEDIAEFRSNDQSMPWLHAFHDWADDAVAPFEVEAIPRAILVGSDGVILASDSECRGERLHETLEQVLGAGS